MNLKLYIMNDEITINLRALTENALVRISNIIDEELNAIPNETNEESLDIINEFINSEY